ncbi:MAG: O-succinylhomoserine sulfhydrylase, partial [Acidobacteria bacterium]|nr:O-succinylhomoserine sulfhydrylase [Acidobacteriota bacterium]
MGHDPDDLARESRWALETRSIHVGQHPDPTYGAVAPPIYQTSTFAFDSPAQGARRFAGTEPGYIYSRMSNPTTARLEECIASLEGGTGALATASGMAAVSAVFLSHLRSGDHVIAAKALFGSCRFVVEEFLPRYGIASTLVDGTDLDQWRAAMRPNTKTCFLESPTNPTLSLVDIAAVAEIAHAGARRWSSTMCSRRRMLQSPLALGARFGVVYS